MKPDAVDWRWAGALQAVAPFPSHPVVRIPQGDMALIKQVLEIGATTLLVPMVETVEQARELVRPMRYPPEGVPGVGSGLARSSRWSGYPDYQNEANRHMCLLVQVETAAALAQVDAIAAVDGVDEVFIGPADLSASMGHLGQPGHPAVRAAIEAGLPHFLAAGKAPGILAVDESLARRYIELGARFVAVGVEATMLAQATRALAARFKGEGEVPSSDTHTGNTYLCGCTPMDDIDLGALRALFSGRLHSAAVDRAAILTDWRGKWTGRAMAVAQPDSTGDVAAILGWCHRHRIPVVPQGGNTGLSGGSTPDDSGNALALSLVRMNKVRSIDTLNNTKVADAGLTLLQAQETARNADRLFPLRPAAQGTCTIGGNLTTNAGGVQVLRYGTARELCLGQEVVTAEGDVWNSLRGLRKDNTGYNLRDLFIGSEGTLGIITGATLKLFPKPAAQMVAFAAVPSAESAVQMLLLAQARLGSVVTAFGLISDACIALVEKHVASSRLPLAERSPWCVLLEVSGSHDEAHAHAAIEDLRETAMAQELASDAAISASLEQLQALWALCEDISESQGAEGKTIKHDISLPISASRSS